MMGPEEAALAIVSQFGLSVREPVVISDSNNVVLWLRPAPVVAKAGTGLHSRLELEMDVAKHLKARGAPIVSPTDELPQEVHRVGGIEVTFWDYKPADEQEPNPVDVARALFALHRALRDYSNPLPSFQDELSYVAELLSDAGRLELLPEDDRLLLMSAEHRFRAELARCDVKERLLHGAPHSDNTIRVGGEVLFIDFETSCVGPLEWDLAHCSDEVVNAYPQSADRSILAVCRALVSVKTAALCWARFEHPALQWHAKHHLDVVKELVSSSG
jgi:aminoglycoside phosphotransferase (APT) family kinase protein